MKYPSLSSSSRLRQGRSPFQIAQGFSLVEIMVSLAIGLVVVGAVFANFLNSSAGTRQAAAMAQVTQDAALAMGILRNHIAVAGFSRPQSISGSGAMTPYFSGQAVFGCTEGFTTATDNSANYASIGCNTTSTAGTTPKPDSLAISYEADVDSTPSVTSGTTSAPTDCVGDGLVAQGTAPNDYYVADNRFAIIPEVAATTTLSASPPSLGCMGNGGITPGQPLQKTSSGGITSNKGYQALVENISDMRIWYGVGASATGSTPAGKNVTKYVTAKQIKDDLANDWSSVLSIRICVLARSSEAVLTAATPYIDCDGNVVSNPPDRRIYRAFKTTVVLNNRI
jgi:type IV pilus assembly protein PilW